MRRWKTVRSDELSRWFSSTSERHLAADVVELAVAFGWGSYHAATLTTLWGPSLENRLGAEWESTGAPEGATWGLVASAVRHGWERASAGADREAPPGQVPEPAPEDPSR